MRIIFLTSDTPAQVALSHKIANIADLEGIFITRFEKKSPQPKRLKTIFSKIAYRLVARPLLKAWRGMEAKYKSLYPAWTDSIIKYVPNINDDETIKAIESIKPDIVVVSGTELVNTRLIECCQANTSGIINLHTGISPYIKGGPNCTNWCLAENAFHLIGNTVMYIDKGIDTGNIILTERTPLTGKENLFELHWKVMEHAHEVYIRTIEKLTRESRLNSIPQKQICEGKTFYTREWGPAQALKAMKNFYQHYSVEHFNSESFKQMSRKLDLVSL